MNRILFEQDEVGKPLPSDDDRAKHLTRVLDVDVGDVVEIGVIGGRRGTGTVTRRDRDGVELSFDFDDEHSVDEPYPITVLLGHPRPIVLKRILKDLTTLGVERILVAGTDNGEKSYLNSNLWKGDSVRRYLIDGAAQAGVTFIPDVSRESSMSAALDFLEETTMPTSGDWNLQLLALDNQAFHPQFSRSELQAQRVVVAVGSERGFSDAERIQLRDRGFGLYSMGPRVLRTETAAVCAVALVLAKIGWV